MIEEDERAAALLQEEIDNFGSARSIDIEVIKKLPEGEGGLLDFLIVSQPVAPAALPDVIALPLSDAALAASKGLLQPLDAFADPYLLDDFNPFLQGAVRTKQGWFAVPFTVWFEHLAFQPSALTDPPLSWPIILDARATYAFPAAGPEGVLPDALLIHYLSSVPPGEDPVRNEGALHRTLTFYQTARASGLIDSSVTQAVTADDVWPRVVQGAVALADTTSTLWLTDRNQAILLRFGPLPTADGRPRYIGHGWAYAIVAADEQRQVLSADLIEQLTAAEFLAQWGLTAHRLPARRSALAIWPADSYATFATEALESATPLPAWITDIAFTRSLHRAIIDVLSGAADVDTAVQTAIQSW